MYNNWSEFQCSDTCSGCCFWPPKTFLVLQWTTPNCYRQSYLNQWLLYIHYHIPDKLGNSWDDTRVLLYTSALLKCRCATVRGCELGANRLVNKKTQLSLTNPPRRESMPKIAPIRRAYNVVADNTGLSSFVLAVVASEICEISRNSLKIQTYRVQGHPRSSILMSIESAYVTSY